MKPELLLKAMFQGAVDAALPSLCVPAHLPKRPKGRTVVIGAGKASGAMAKALGDKKGIVRFGTGTIPMDETLVSAAVDLSGRPFLVFSVPVTRSRVSNFDLDLLQEFFRAFAFNAEITLHVTMHYGHNLHHITEAVFKAVGRALAQATRHDPRIAGILPSTKGAL